MRGEREEEGHSMRLGGVAGTRCVSMRLRGVSFQRAYIQQAAIQRMVQLHLQPRRGRGTGRCPLRSAGWNPVALTLMATIRVMEQKAVNKCASIGVRKRSLVPLLVLPVMGNEKWPMRMNAFEKMRPSSPP